MCNYNFIRIPPFLNNFSTQECKYLYAKEDGTILSYKNCIDPWCFTFMTAVNFCDSHTFSYNRKLYFLI